MGIGAGRLTAVHVGGIFKVLTLHRFVFVCIKFWFRLSIDGFIAFFFLWGGVTIIMFMNE